MHGQYEMMGGSVGSPTSKLVHGVPLDWTCFVEFHMKSTEATEAYLNGEKLEGLSSRQAKRNDPSGNVAKSKRG